MAASLVAELTRSGLLARAHNTFHDWTVVCSAGSRTLEISCFMHGPRPGALLLGMNPANARSSLGARWAPLVGAEYSIYLKEGDLEIAEGRTQESRLAVACARAWLGGASLEAVVEEVPFVDAQRRALRSFARSLDPSLRLEFSRRPCYVIWAHSEGRSCELRFGIDALSCSFRLRAAQVAYASNPAPSAVEAWLLRRVPIRELGWIAGVELEKYAELLESDPSRWHWLHLTDRMADPDDVLAEHAPLIAALARSDIATRFYTFSSLNRLCFSASSHYPWLKERLPVIAPSQDGHYVIDNIKYELSAAIEQIERRLLASPYEPIAGTADDYVLVRMNAALERLGSALRAELVPREDWFCVEVPISTGRPRIIELDAGGSVAVDSEQFSSFDEAAAAINRRGPIAP